MLVIWVKPNGEIYHKYVSGMYADYHVGYINSYDHQIIYIIDNLYYRFERPPFKNRLKRKLINYIDKM